MTRPGAVRQIAELDDPTEAALAPERVAEPFGLTVLLRDVVDRPHNTTRFVVLVPGQLAIAEDADKTTVAFTTAHIPGSAGPGVDRVRSAGSKPDPNRVTSHRGSVALSHVRGSDPSAGSRGHRPCFRTAAGDSLGSAVPGDLPVRHPMRLVFGRGGCVGRPTGIA